MKLAEVLDGEEMRRGRGGSHDEALRLRRAREVLLGIAKAVGMIDPQAANLSALDELQEQPVARLEHLGILHAQCGQVVSPHMSGARGSSPLPR